MPTIQPRRGLILSLVAISILLFLSLFYRFQNRDDGVRTSDLGVDHAVVPTEILHGNVIAPKLGNETIKAELGRAAWKLFHTTMARFPDRPTADESAALRSYILLFARLYPCGECASHFRQILSKFPPQVSSRSTAAAWACHVHNEVNKSLKKDIFDCSKIGDFYDCGCAEDDDKSRSEAKSSSDRLVKANNGKDPPPLELEKEGLTKGG